MYPLLRTTKTITIAEGETDSAAVSLDDGAMAALRMPADLDGTTLTLLVGDEPDDLVPHYDGGGAWTLPFTAEVAEPLPPELLSFKFLALRSSASETADRTFVLALK